MTKCINLTIILTALLLSISCHRTQNHDTPGNKPFDEAFMLSDAQIQLGNIKTIEVRESLITQEFQLTGSLKADEKSNTSISTRAAGRIEKLFVKNKGETVNEGDSLYSFYCEDLVNAEKEYVNLQSNNWNYSAKYEPSLEIENKLRLLGMSPSQIQKLRKDGKILFMVTIFSKVSGTVKSIRITEGAYVNPGDVLFELADYRKLWAEATVFQADMRYIENGQRAYISIPDYDDNKTKSRIVFVSPSLLPGSNAAIVRAEIENLERKLYPGMPAIITVYTGGIKGIVIPSTAVIAGNNDARVWVREADGSFTWKNVTTGIETPDSVEILSGLYEYDRVVTSGVYLLNSEFILKNGPDAN